MGGCLRQMSFGVVVVVVVVKMVILVSVDFKNKKMQYSHANDARALRNNQANTTKTIKIENENRQERK